jgi:hypothetical protein
MLTPINFTPLGRPTPLTNPVTWCSLGVFCGMT